MNGSGKELEILVCSYPFHPCKSVAKFLCTSGGDQTASYLVTGGWKALDMCNETKRQESFCFSRVAVTFSL
jgi:hypothetical protein